MYERVHGFMEEWMLAKAKLLHDFFKMKVPASDLCSPKDDGHDLTTEDEEDSDEDSAEDKVRKKEL